MVCNKDYFDRKKEWSVLKDEILSCYLKPYLTKISSTQRPTVLIDCFAGKGRFSDGSNGSPIIIAEYVKSFSRNADVSAIFIEKKYIADLRQNVKDYQSCDAWHGTFEKNLSKILGMPEKRNLFFYIDPYGIKSLDFTQFLEIKKKQFASVELLLNFNSFGFLREGCRLLKYDAPFDGYDDYDDYEIDDTNDVEHMNTIAHGDYWIQIVQSFKAGSIVMHQAEEMLVSEYLKKLKGIFNHVLSIPIKTRCGNIPKYRMVYATNHKDGFKLMADIMNKRWNKIVEQDRNGAIPLFNDLDLPDIWIRTDFDIREGILSVLTSSPRGFSEVLVDLVEKFGIAFSEKEYRKEINEMNGAKLSIIRPASTPTGRAVTALDDRCLIKKL